MKPLPRAIVLLLSLVYSCVTPVGTYFFNGYVYDGITGEQLKDYDIRMLYADQIVEGQVKNGRFSLGPIGERTDYTIIVEASGYRAFTSHNRGMNGNTFPAGSNVGEEHQLHEVMLYPSDLASPPATIRVLLADSVAKPSGTLLLRPVEAQDGPGYSPTVNVAKSPVDDQSPSIIGSRWWNSNDVHSGIVTSAFSDGLLQLDEGSLSLGVAYEVIVYGVTGYALPAPVTFTSGVSSETIVTLQRADAVTDLAIIDRSNRFGGVQANGTLTFSFNYEIELDPQVSPARLTDLVDATITAYAFGPSGLLQDVSAQLSPATMAGPQRGVSVTVSAHQLVFSVSSLTGMFATPVAAPDFLAKIVYALPPELRVRRKGFPSAPRTLLQIDPTLDPILAGEVVVQAF